MQLPVTAIAAVLVVLQFHISNFFVLIIGFFNFCFLLYYVQSCGMITGS